MTHEERGHVFTYRRKGSAASLMTPADVPAGMIAGARYLHASGISQAISASAAAAVSAAIDAAKQAGVKVSYDTNFRPRCGLPPKPGPSSARCGACRYLKTSAKKTARHSSARRT